eukprot:3019088-Rhodomonas_salina.5
MHTAFHSERREQTSIFFKSPLQPACSFINGSLTSPITCRPARADVRPEHTSHRARTLKGSRDPALRPRGPRLGSHHKSRRQIRALHSI